MITSHPKFRSAVKLAAIFVVLLNIFSTVSALALTYIDTSQTTFGGTFGNTSWNVANSGVSINSAFTG